MKKIDKDIHHGLEERHLPGKRKVLSLIPDAET